MAKKRQRRGRGEGSIEELPSGKYRVVVSAGKDPETGKRRKLTETFDSKADAVAWRNEQLEKMRKGTLPRAGKMTVGDWLREWLKKVEPTVEPLTYLPYERDVNKALIPRLGAVPLGELTAERIEQAYTELVDGQTASGEKLAKRLSAAMVRKAATTLGVALQAAVKKRLIPFNPARDADKPALPSRVEPAAQVLDPSQVGLFLDAAKEDRYCALFALWLDTGAREGELFALHWPDVDWQGRAVTVTKNLEEIKGKHRIKVVKTDKSRRRIAIGAYALDALAEHRKKMLAEGRDVKDGPVFCDTKGGFLRKSNFQRRHFDKVLQKAGLPDIRPYDLRHTCATLLLLAGEDVKVVSARWGHSTTRLTLDTYQHVLPGMQERAAAKLDAIFNAPREQRQAE